MANIDTLLINTYKVLTTAQPTLYAHQLRLISILYATAVTPRPLYIANPVSTRFASLTMH